MLNVNNFSYSYNDKPFLHDISFSVNEGELVGFIGRNGAGKSTIFKCLLTLINNYKGEITLYEKNTKNMSAKEISTLISYIPQIRKNTFNYNVYDTILMGTNNQLSIFESPGKKQYEITDNAITLLGLENLKYKSFAHLSGGQQQLVLIARAIAQNTKLIIMDEPTSALDYGNQEFVMKKIKDLTKTKNIGILISCHSPNLVLKYCNRIIAINNGKIIANGNTKDVLNEILIETLYNIKTKIYETENGPYIQSIY